jgi:hypothetical protein
MKQERKHTLAVQAGHKMNLNRRISRKLRKAGSHLSLEHFYHPTIQLGPGGHLIRSRV